jgi:hypothetical protein
MAVSIKAQGMVFQMGGPMILILWPEGCGGKGTSSVMPEIAR